MKHIYCIGTKENHSYPAKEDILDIMIAKVVNTSKRNAITAVRRDWGMISKAITQNEDGSFEITVDRNSLEDGIKTWDLQDEVYRKLMDDAEADGDHEYVEHMQKLLFDGGGRLTIDQDANMASVENYLREFQYLKGDTIIITKVYSYDN